MSTHTANPTHATDRSLLPAASLPQQALGQVDRRDLAIFGRELVDVWVKFHAARRRRARLA